MVKKVRASAHGLERVEERRRWRNWTKYDQQWQDKAGVSESTLKRFWKPEEVKIDTFIKICEALEIDWETITAESDRSDRLVVGETICDRYEILELRTDKENYKIYLGKDLHLPDSPKCLVTQLGHHSSEKAKDLLDREARTLHQLRQNTQIPQLYAYFPDDEQDRYLIKEYIEGNPLEKEIIEKKPWLEEDVINFLDEMLKILRFVHKRKVIHRKINPKNIIRRTSDKKLVLVHFGQIIYYGNQTDQNDKTDQHKENKRKPSFLDPTDSKYSLLFIAPEQGIGSPEFSSDLYSLGRIAIQMLTGQNLTEIKIEYDTCNIDWHPDRKTHLTEFIDKMVEYDPKNRYESAETALKAFKQTFTK